MEQATDLKVFITSRDSTCDECGENLGRKAWITLNKDKGALCLACADLDHLVFLPSGNTALTRRAHQNAILSAIVLKWSQHRKRYERQGLLVEEKALEQAEKECLAEDDVRGQQRVLKKGQFAWLLSLISDMLRRRMTSCWLRATTGGRREIKLKVKSAKY